MRREEGVPLSLSRFRIFRNLACSLAREGVSSSVLEGV